MSIPEVNLWFGFLEETCGPIKVMRREKAKTGGRIPLIAQA
ncbi:hypothetical protein [Methanoregula sp.]